MQYPEFERFSLEQRGQVLTLRFNRPQMLNCWDMQLNDELFRALDQAADDTNVRIIIFTGSGRSFCSGGDLAEFRAGIQKDAATYISTIVRKSHEIILQVRKMGKIAIAAVNGLAAGSGFNLALACDFRVAAASARFSQRFVRVGLSPDTGGTFFLPQLIGTARATELLMTGDFIDADAALRLGLVNSVVEDSRLDMATSELIDRLAHSAFQAQIAAKRLINQSSLAALATHMDAEREAMMWSATTPDFKEGVTAFLEKRRPQFVGV
jgi:2-(1,2-epoxy-1,2-dihydrophenyl)acetyl-CoA isomerase